MAQTLIQGVRTTATQNTETRRTRDVFPSLLKLDPDISPFTVLMGKLRKRVVDDPKPEWFEDQSLPVQDILGGAVSAGASTITVTNYKYFRAGDILLFLQTGEQVLVTATPSSTTVSVTRAWGEVSAAAVDTATKIKIIGSASEENDSSRDVLSTQKVPKFNYVGIVRDPFAVSNTAKVTKTYAGMDFEEEAANMLFTHKKKLELMNLQGQRYEDTTGTEPRRSTRGIVNWITTNVLNVGGGLTEPVWDSFLRRIFQFGSSQKVVFDAPIVTQAISGFAKEKLRPSDVMMKKYGMNITEYISPFGTVLLANHKLMTNDDLNDFDDLAGMAIAVDMSYVEMVHTKARISVRKENIQNNDVDGRKDEYLSEAGIRVSLEKVHGKLTGVTA